MLVVPCDPDATLPGKPPEPASSPARLMISIQPGQTIGMCRIESELGKGGMGAVYLATHTRLDVPVAVKILPPNDVAENPEFIERFIREAKLAARIQHPNVVGVMDVDQDSHTGLYYIVMQYIPGGSVKDLISEGPVGIEKALDITIGVAKALVKAAELGIIHRDIKPANIMLDSHGEPKLADLGLAKNIDKEGPCITMSTSSLGTPAYMSLEQIEDTRSVDARADIYSLGATLYHILTGVLPFAGETTFSTLSKVIAGPTPDPRALNPDVPDPVALVCMKAMARDREERYQTAQEFLEDLLKVRGGITDLTRLTAASLPESKAEKSGQHKEPASQVLESDPESNKMKNEAPVKAPRKRLFLVGTVAAGILAAAIAAVFLMPSGSKRTSETKIASGGSSEQSTSLPVNGGKPADMTKPVKVFILLGELDMYGCGNITGSEGSLENAVKNKKKYSYLVDAAGNWTERKDVRFVRYVSGKGLNNEWLGIKQGTIGPEYGIGHVLGNSIDAPVMLLKCCNGNRSLGWDLLPPGSKRFEEGGMVYAGYKDSPAKWAKGTEPAPAALSWYAGKEYDVDVADAKNALAELEKHYPGAKKHEVAGFFFWQGVKDKSDPVHVARYEQNLVNFIKQLRKDFNAPDAKFVLATEGQAVKDSGDKVTEAQLAVDGNSGKYPEFKGNVATIYSKPLSLGGSSVGYKRGYAETFMNVGEAMGKAMVDLLSSKGKPTLGQVSAKPPDDKLDLYRSQVEKAWPKSGAGLKVGSDGSLVLQLSKRKDVVDLQPLQGIPLTSLNLTGLQVSDLTPLEGIPLKQLVIRGTNVKDLSPLRGMQLTELILGAYGQEGCAPVTDFTPLKGMPLTNLDINFGKISDLSPLKGLPLNRLILSKTPVNDLAPLTGMPLTSLHLTLTQVADLSPLKGMPLTEIVFNNTKVSDLTPLRDMPLTSIEMNDTPVNDLTPLKDMKLTLFVFTPKNITKGLEVIRNMTSIQQIATGGYQKRMPPAEFWKKYDAGEFKE